MESFVTENINELSAIIFLGMTTNNGRGGVRRGVGAGGRVEGGGGRGG